MSIAAVSHKHAFGIKSNIQGCIHWLDESTVVYPCGSNCVVYQNETKTQKFIPMQESWDKITAMVLSPNKRFIAVAESGESSPAIVVYDLVTFRKRKVLVVPPIDGTGQPSPTNPSNPIPPRSPSNNTQSHAVNKEDPLLKEIVSLCFTPDSKWIGSLTTGPDQWIQYWSWEKSKLISQTNLFVTLPQYATHVSFNPWDSTQVSVTGIGVFKLFRFSEGNVRQLSSTKVDSKNYLAHCWLNETRLIVSSLEGQLIIFDNGEPKHEMVNLVGLSGISRDVLVIVPTSQGFACGCEDGQVTFYDKVNDSNYSKSREYFIPDDQQSDIANMAITPNEETLLVASKSAQLYSSALGTIDSKVCTRTKLEPFALPFHASCITGLDTCIRKPLVATCSSDRSVRIWNYVDATSDMVKYFDEESHSVAFHPSGLYVLVGFSDKLRLLNLLIDDIRPFREFHIRGCRECKFSNGGQYFAAVNANVILIYNTWTFECLGTLKGHNGKVRSLFWSHDDSRLVSAGLEGAIYEWNVLEMRREAECVIKTCAYTSAVARIDDTAKAIYYAVGSDRTLKEIKDSTVTQEMPSSIVLKQLAISHSGRMLFAGTSTGSIRSIKFPITTNISDFQEHKGHSSAVTRLHVSADDKHLFSTSEDGSLYVWKISEKDAVSVRDMATVESLGGARNRTTVYVDEILVTKSDLEDKTLLVNELRARVEEQKMENEYQLRLKDMAFAEKAKEINEKYLDEIDRLKETCSVLKADKEKEENRYLQQVADEKSKHQDIMDMLEKAHSSKLMTEYEKYQDLQHQSTLQEQAWAKQAENLEHEKQKMIKELTSQHEVLINAKQAAIEKLQKHAQQQINDLEETSRETEEDADQEILLIKNKYELLLKEEREIGLRLKGENGIMLKKFNKLNAEIEAHKGEIQKMVIEEKKLHVSIKGLEKDIVGLKKEIQERDETIQDKEKRIYDLKKKNQELEKFKFVLDYKIKEFKKQIEPREKDIVNMTQQIKEMEQELHAYNKENANLEILIANLRQKLKSSKYQVSVEKAKSKHLQTAITQFKVDLNACAAHLQDPALLKAKVRHLYQTYCVEKHDIVASISPPIHQQGDTSVRDTDTLERHNQRVYLERTISGLRAAVLNDQTKHKADHVKIMTENVSLIKEINQLRRDLKSHDSARLLGAQAK